MQPSICFSCARLLTDEESEQKTCEAFPEGVPVEIASGERDHRGAWPGDGGKRYVMRDDEFAPAELQLWLDVTGRTE